MLAEVKNLQNIDSKSLTLWLNKTRGTLPHEEDELAKAIQKKIARRNMAESKPVKNATSNKTCICAPTNHAGSFRCHLHRISVAWSVQDSRSRSKLQCEANLNANAKNGLHDVVEKQPKLSRFGRAASARSCHENLPLTMAEQVN
ncbi:uncharacterized protein Pyn_05228 [Prunus yedoensis var. nudiflora]|uniref:Uncharacterized protein n=1 Tax=Prunus yedoensis var. nudiflora TaxID=2094558 RepID=A0A314U819_PRUYE|nr:uncharacterized protein Pyn_05228 [Prunus yedoensis var. nudiflora]